MNRLSFVVCIILIALTADSAKYRPKPRPRPSKPPGPPSCKAMNEGCAKACDCCSGVCDPIDGVNQCSCKSGGAICANSDECCTGNCTEGVCICDSASPVNNPCNTDANCCEGQTCKENSPGEGSKCFPNTPS